MVSDDRRTTMRPTAFVLPAIAAAAAVATLTARADDTAPPAVAAQASTHRTDLLRRDLVAPGREAVQVRVDFDPGAVAGRHSHPGEEVAYVLEGTLEYRIDGKPAVTLRAGEVLFIPAGAIHAAKNVGKTRGSELATYIVEKGKPLLVPAK
jgi:quercetin dioxygenase-like cupin family protein